MQAQPGSSYGPSGPYGGPPGGNAPAPMALAGFHSIAKPTIAILAARAALPILFMVLGKAGLLPGPAVVYDAIEGLLTFTGLIFYFVWYARMNGWLRATQGPTGYSTGLAIGGWFIPFGNFVIPCLALADLWKRATRGRSAGLVVLWWLSYLASTVLAVFFSAMEDREIDNLVPLPVEKIVLILNALGWAHTLVTIAAFGLWAFIVKELTAKAA